MQTFALEKQRRAGAALRPAPASLRSSAPVREIIRGGPSRVQLEPRTPRDAPPPPPPEPPKEKGKKPAEWAWWDAECRPAPDSVPVATLVQKAMQVVAAGRKMGYNLAADNLENYLLGKKSFVKLPTKTLSENPLVREHLGPDANWTPSETLIRQGIVKGKNYPAEHHVVLLSGVLRRLEDGSKKIGQTIDVTYEDSINFYVESLDKYPDLAYGIAGCTVHSEAQLETAVEGGQVLAHYRSWKAWITDEYNFDKGKTALFTVGGFCIPDSDMVRIKEAGYAKDFSMATDKWSNMSAGLNMLWIPIPYRPPSP